MPMAAHVDRETRPHHQVRRRRPDLLIAAGAAIRLRRRHAGQAAHDPLVATRVGLDELEPAVQPSVAVFVRSDIGRRSAGRSGAARTHAGTVKAKRSAPAYTFIDVPRRNPTSVIPTDSANSTARLDGADTAASTGMPAT